MLMKTNMTLIFPDHICTLELCMTRFWGVEKWEPLVGLSVIVPWLPSEADDSWSCALEDGTSTQGPPDYPQKNVLLCFRMMSIYAFIKACCYAFSSILFKMIFYHHFCSFYESMGI